MAVQPDLLDDEERRDTDHAQNERDEHFGRDPRETQAAPGQSKEHQNRACHDDSISAERKVPQSACGHDGAR